MAGMEKELEKEIEDSEENITGGSTVDNSPPPTAEVDTETFKNLSNPDAAIATNTAETISSTGSSNVASKEGNSSYPEGTSETQQLSSAGISLIKLYSDSSSSNSSSSESDSDEDDTTTAQSLDHHNNDEDDTEDCNTYPVGSGNRKYGYPMIADEVDYRDLPPPGNTAPCLPPSIPLSPIGTVLHTIEQLTIIESYPDQPTVDEGTHLWSDEREYIGELFETIGPVKKPFYTIRMSIDEESHTLPPGKEIFIAKDEKNFTKYVLKDKLREEKWSDASWKNDSEVPLELQEPSDDEEERNRAGKGANKDKKKNKNNKQQGNQNQRYNYAATRTDLPPALPPHPPSPYLSFPPPVPPPFPVPSLPPPPFNFPPLPPPPPFPPPSLPPFPPSSLPPPLPPSLPFPLPPPPLPPYTIRQAYHNNNNNTRTRPPPFSFRPSFNDSCNK
ncbi:PREDICTED: H/ACA ribonucleoprotein complex non-core subunit NAF1-like isoform X2 [Amphimedon queenslandica]|uniref:H/ACA ribonucleoprotein complex non-core subunit NAF1 n=1 Tax=Amphimedon queenslandica TaxID=400682 RepID=A0AAN0IM05_AMPQE|nr:PREDICTED: H/ACA ribonucleoprotein complex non-core subunit NAF1-like isoform X2 [Amphimedon queenslandica]|eukprot:XP_011404032.1 PREDICTED: H/ACA ribonucleoprotein complex non-core subunit NAF1-like isoform X2 [Amphimedon queenslandica]